jgi:hypothetical protein
MSNLPDLPKVPFLSPRNVPLWAGLVLVVIVLAMIRWLG